MQLNSSISRALASVCFSVNWQKFAACDGKILKPIRQPWWTKILGGSYRRLGDAVHGRKSCTLSVLLLLWLLTMCVGALSHTIISLKTRFSRSPFSLSNSWYSVVAVFVTMGIGWRKKSSSWPEPCRYPLLIVWSAKGICVGVIWCICYSLQRACTAMGIKTPNLAPMLTFRKSQFIARIWKLSPTRSLLCHWRKTPDDVWNVWPFPKSYPVTWVTAFWHILSSGCISSLMYH